ncbi:alanyl-tRNA editing protein [Fodinicurvata fenggangensis]|uniref:alanyl-tRNA editing protein n=1 Tax=Fodinicurvata fenggangensis TaxID=1121830 RepID=UPI00047DB68A|nr:alanyl-tRNA editing protein [Fodinicurvata fenggangensis]
MELLFRDDPYLKSCRARVTDSSSAGVRFDRTIFYPEGGGQPGDTGLMRLSSGAEVNIIDAQKHGDDDQDVLHLLAADSPVPDIGEEVELQIDWERRHRLMRMHTSLHLLCSLVEGDVTGGQISDGKGRLDFNLPEGAPDKTWLTENLNDLVRRAVPVSVIWASDEELDNTPELVRTMSVKPPRGSGRVRMLQIEGVDLQPCGGTHVSNTSEIGRLEVGKIENKGRQNRRINLRFASQEAGS